MGQSVAALADVRNHVQHNLRLLARELVAVVSEPLEQPMNMANRPRRIRLIDAAMKHRHVVTVLDERPNNVAADESCPAQNNDPHLLSIASRLAAAAADEKAALRESVVA